VVGVLSIAYGALLGLFWAWVFWRDWGRQEGGWSGGRALLMVLSIAAPVVLAVAGYGLFSARIAGPDARALKVAAVVVLAAKAAVAGYWVIGLIAATGAFSDVLHQAGCLALAVEVVPSSVWAAVLALTSLPTDDPPTPEEPLC
jgi:hypothetical protein